MCPLAHLKAIRVAICWAKKPNQKSNGIKVQRNHKPTYIYGFYTKRGFKSSFLPSEKGNWRTKTEGIHLKCKNTDTELWLTYNQIKTFWKKASFNYLAS